MAKSPYSKTDTNVFGPLAQQCTYIVRGTIHQAMFIDNDFNAWLEWEGYTVGEYTRFGMADVIHSDGRTIMAVVHKIVH